MGSLCSKSSILTGGHTNVGTGPQRLGSTENSPTQASSADPEQRRKAILEAAEERRRKLETRGTKPGGARVIAVPEDTGDSPIRALDWN